MELTKNLPSIIDAACNREGLSDGAKSMCALRIMAEELEKRFIQLNTAIKEVVVVTDKKKSDLIDTMDAFSHAAVSQYQSANKLYVDAAANTAQALHSLQTEMKEAIVEADIHVTNELNKSMTLIHDSRDQVLTTSTEIKQKQTEMNTKLFTLDAAVHDTQKDIKIIKDDVTQIKTDLTSINKNIEKIAKRK